VTAGGRRVASPGSADHGSAQCVSLGGDSRAEGTRRGWAALLQRRRKKFASSSTARDVAVAQQNSPTDGGTFSHNGGEERVVALADGAACASQADVLHHGEPAGPGRSGPQSRKRFQWKAAVGRVIWD